MLDFGLTSRPRTVFVAYHPMDLDALHAGSDGLIPGELASVPRRSSTQQIHNPLDLFPCPSSPPRASPPPSRPAGLNGHPRASSTEARGGEIVAPAKMLRTRRVGVRASRKDRSGSVHAGTQAALMAAST